MLFSQITGHERQLGFIRRITESERLAHAYLFSGPSGIGKARVAFAMACSLLCSGAGSEACGVCPDCRKFKSANHPDFIHILPDGAFIKIEQIRELKKNLSFSPLGGGKRVIVMEDAHLMRREAGNSLLKILEEPPPDNVFIIVAGGGHRLLATIVSRCQLIDFAPLTTEQTINIIRQETDVDSRQAGVLSFISEGSPGKALLIAESAVIDLAEKVIVFLLATLNDKGPQQVEKGLLLASMIAEVDEIELVFDFIRLFFKEVMLCLADYYQQQNFTILRARDIPILREEWNLSDISVKLSLLDEAVSAISANCNRNLVCEVLLLELMGS